MDVRTFFTTKPKAVAPPKTKTKKPTAEQRQATLERLKVEMEERRKTRDAEWADAWESEKAQGGLRQRIAELLETARFGNGGELTARQIAKAVGADKHDVNKILYGTPSVYNYLTGGDVVMPRWFRNDPGSWAGVMANWEAWEERLSSYE